MTIVKPQQRWEYKVIFYIRGEDEPSLEEYLNDFGSEGWELISDKDDRLIFKRPKPDIDALFREPSKPPGYSRHSEAWR